MDSRTQQPTSLQVQAEVPEPLVHLEHTADEHSFLDPTFPMLIGKIAEATVNGRISTQLPTWDNVLHANPGISKLLETKLS